MIPSRPEQGPSATCERPPVHRISPIDELERPSEVALGSGDVDRERMRAGELQAAGGERPERFGELEATCCLRKVVRGRVVVGDDARVILGALPPLLLQPRGGGGVAACPLRPRLLAVRHVAGQRVPEEVLLLSLERGRRGWTYKLAIDERSEDPRQLCARQWRHRLHAAQPEGLTEHGGVGECRLVRARQRIQACGKHGADRVRRGRALPAGHSRRAGGRKDAAVGEQPGVRLGEERVECDSLPVGKAAPLPPYQGLRVALQRPRELQHQPALPDAGLADDQAGATPAEGSDCGERLLKRMQFVVAPDKGPAWMDRRAQAGPRDGPDRPPHRKGSLLAFGGNR